MVDFVAVVIVVACKEQTRERSQDRGSTAFNDKGE